MLKKILKYLIVFALISCSENDKVSEIIYSQPSGALKIKRGSAGYSEYLYDNQKRLVLINHFFESGERYSYNEFKYADSTYIDQEISYIKSTAASETFSRKTTNSYVYEGELLAKIISENEEFNNTEQIFSYDESGNKIRSAIYSQEGEVISFTTFSHLEGKLFREFQYDGDSNLISAYEYQYNQTGNQHHRIFLAADSTSLGIERDYSYNDAGQLISEQSYDPYFGFARGEVTFYEYYE